MDLDRDQLRLAADCTLRTTGNMLGGIVHNLNNPTHALAMQAELLVNNLKKKPDKVDASALQKKCERLRFVGEEFKGQLDVLTWRHSYTVATPELLDPVHFGTWLLQFWRNNLFFKHSVTVDLESDPPPPHVQVVPLALLWSLEEPLHSMAEAFGHGQSRTEFGMRFEIRDIASQGVQFRIVISPASQANSFSLPPLEHEQSIRDLTQSLGWDWKYSSAEGMLSLSLTIPLRPAA